MVTTASVKQLEKKLSLKVNENRLLKMTNEVMMRKYGVQNTVVEKRVEKLVKVVSSYFFRVAMYIRKAIPK